MNYYKNDASFAIEKHVGNVLAGDEHFHGLYEFYYLKCGTAIYLINDKIYHLAKGDVVVIPPNTLHKTISATHEEQVNSGVLASSNKDNISIGFVLYPYELI